MIREKIRARLNGSVLSRLAVKLDYAEQTQASVGARARIPSVSRYEVLIYGSAIKTSHNQQRISHLQISNRRFRQGLASTQAMLSAGLQHSSFHGIIGLLCSQ